MMGWDPNYGRGAYDNLFGNAQQQGMNPWGQLGRGMSQQGRQGMRGQPMQSQPMQSQPMQSPPGQDMGNYQQQMQAWAPQAQQMPQAQSGKVRGGGGK